MYFELLVRGMEYNKSKNPGKKFLGKVFLKISVIRAKRLEESAGKFQLGANWSDIDSRKLLASIQKKIAGSSGI